MVLDSINRTERDNIAGQLDLFGGSDDEPQQESIVIPDLEEFTAREKMAMEKEVTGLYLSGHPMDEYRDVVRRIGAASIGAIVNDFSAEDGPRRFRDDQTVSVAGVVAPVKTRPTKNRSLMSYITLEDDSGSMELVAFQKALDAGGRYLQEGAVLLVRGRITARDEKEPQITADTIRPLSDVAGEVAQTPAPDQKLYVKLPGRDDPALHRIELMLTMFPGRQQMVIWCEKERKRIGAQCRIHGALIAELRRMLGEENVVVK